MNFPTSKTLTRWIAPALLLMTGGAQAHTGHEVVGFISGLAHPLGLDHMLAMFAVGLWSVRALPAQRVWQGPALFMAAMTVGAAMGALGLQLPGVETLIALSVVLFGAMLILSVRQTPSALGSGLIAVAALAHGMAHGAEAPASGWAVYAAGFLLTTGALHLGGVSAGLAIRTFFARHGGAWMLSIGSALGLTGLYLMAQV
jgi:urease accessory protein